MRLRTSPALRSGAASLVKTLLRELRRALEHAEHGRWWDALCEVHAAGMTRGMLLGATDDDTRARLCRLSYLVLDEIGRGMEPRR